MKTFAVFGIFFPIAGALANFSELCGVKVGYTASDLGKLNVYGTWGMKDKCYYECLFEEAGAWENGSFNDAFKTGLVIGVAADADSLQQDTMALSSTCFKEVQSTGCEGAYEFVKCVVGTDVGAGLLLFGSIGGLVGSVAKGH